jgi:hypothetical protein
MADTDQNYRIEMIFPEIQSTDELKQYQAYCDLPPETKNVIVKLMQEDPATLAHLFVTDPTIKDACRKTFIPVGPRSLQLSIFDYVSGELVNALLWQWAYFVLPSNFYGNGSSFIVQNQTYAQSQELYDKIIGPCNETKDKFILVDSDDISDSLDTFRKEGQLPDVAFSWVPMHGTDVFDEQSHFTLCKVILDQEMMTKFSGFDPNKSNEDQMKDLYEWLRSKTFKDQALARVYYAYTAYAVTARKDHDIQVANADTWWLPDVFDFEWYVQVHISRGILEYHIFGLPMEVIRDDM